MKEKLQKKLRDIIYEYEDLYKETKDPQIGTTLRSLRGTPEGRIVAREITEARRAEYQKRVKEKKAPAVPAPKMEKQAPEPEIQEEPVKDKASDMASKTLKELREIAKEVGVKNASKMKKADLIEAILG